MATQSESLDDVEVPRVAPARCPYLRSADGAWVSAAPVADHRCYAVVPPAPLSIPKQRRLCASPEHITCATYLAVDESRAARKAVPEPEAGWGWTRTSPLVDVNVGLRPQLAAALTNGKIWRALPAVALVVVLVVLGGSNLGSNDQVGLSSSAPALLTPTSSPKPIPSPLATSEPSTEQTPSAPVSPAPSTAPPPTAIPTPLPTPRVTPVPSARAQYTVKSGDTLYGIAGQFGISVSALKNFNSITSDVIHVGDVLLIP